jgi:hypothetical protein
MAQQQQGPINALNPGLYTGSLPNMVFMDRDPNSGDYAGYELGYWWIVGPNDTSPTGEVWILVSKLYNIAIWKRLYSASPITTPVSLNKIYLTTPATGVYTPTPGMIQCYVEVVGGGGSGSTQNTFLGSFAVNSAGGGGGYDAKFYTKTQIGASQPYTVGAGGTASRVAGDHVGQDGFDSTFGVIATDVYLKADGGQGGQIAAAIFPNSNMGGDGGTAHFGSIKMDGSRSYFSYMQNAGSPAPVAGGSYSGRSFYGLGDFQKRPDTDTGRPGNNGCGGGGCGVPFPTQLYGGHGGDGLIIITEYIV